MKIAITGALGHIGSKLIRSRLPGDVEIIDNLSTQRYCSLFNLKAGRFIEQDVVLDPPSFEGVDVVVHLAAKTDATNSDELTKVHNFAATKNIADACFQSGAYLIYISSTSVYGQADGIVDEESELNPQSPYAESKILEECYINELAWSGLRYCILRFGTIYGVSPGMRFHTAVNKFCWQAAYGKPLTVWKTALHQKRPYLDLDDAVRAINFCIKNRPEGVLNVLTYNATVKEIIDIIQKHEPTSPVDFVGSKIMNQLSYEVSRDKFCDLGFMFTGNLQRGIEETIKLLRGK